MSAPLVFGVPRTAVTVVATITLTVVCVGGVGAADAAQGFHRESRPAPLAPAGIEDESGRGVIFANLSPTETVDLELQYLSAQGSRLATISSVPPCAAAGPAVAPYPGDYTGAVLVRSRLRSPFPDTRAR